VTVDSIDVGRGVLSLISPQPGDRVYAATAHTLHAWSVPGYTTAASRDYPGCLSSGICSSPDGSLLYVGICSPTAGISVLTLPGLEEVARIPTDGTPDAMCSSPDGRYVFAACGEDSTLIQLTVNGFTAGAEVKLAGEPAAVWPSPSGDRLYVPVSAPADLVQVIDPVTLVPDTTWLAGCNPGGICTSPDGSLVYLALTGDDYVASISSADGTLADSVLIGAIPTGLAILPDGSHLYTANAMGYSGTIIRASDMTVAGTITSGFRGGVVCTSPDGSRVYAASGQDGYIYVSGY
jgi:DNA-binding beta-propeller fold protein YncE